MTVSYTYYEKENFLYTKFSGVLTDEDLRTTIRTGVSGKMPASPNLSDQDVLDIIALLRSWR
jgi:hypothetical protein